MDGLGLTFAFPVRYTHNISNENGNMNQTFKKADITKKGSTLSTYNRATGFKKSFGTRLR
jgi:hypothetical protein